MLDISSACAAQSGAREGTGFAKKAAEGLIRTCPWDTARILVVVDDIALGEEQGDS